MGWNKFRPLIEMQSFLEKGFVLSQLDGEGMGQMEHQQHQASEEAFKVNKSL